MASTTQPTIIWKQYTLVDNGLSQGQTLSGNTVDYNAVQAGQYSPAICVRPQFSDSTTSGAIGSVRLWWSTYSAKNPSNSDVDLPSNGWVLKYYITDCTASQHGDTTANLAITTRCAKMLKYLSASDRVTKVATGKTFTVGTGTGNVSFDSNQWTWCKSVWQGSTDNTSVSMQPVPFSGYKDTQAQHVTEFSTRYGGGTSWLTTVFGLDSSASTSDLLYYAVGGVLSGSSYKCNVKGYVNSNDTDTNNNTSGFPYIFFTIKAPTTADAGTWSGWACRISYIWPYTASSTNV